MAEKDELGTRGEQIAVDYLERKGLRVVDRNWRCRQGEIDIVAHDRGELVFVEVRTRSGLGYGHPVQTITAPKLARMKRLAFAWCAAHPGPRRPFRLDVVGILPSVSGEHDIDHLVRVF
jgi:putative endonuclease